MCLALLQYVMIHSNVVSSTLMQFAQLKCGMLMLHTVPLAGIGYIMKMERYLWLVNAIIITKIKDKKCWWLVYKSCKNIGWLMPTYHPGKAG